MSIRPPCLGLDYTPAWQQGAGIGRYVRELVDALAAADQSTACRLFVAGARQSRLPPPPGPNFAWRPTRLSSRWLSRIWHRAHLPLPVECFTGPLSLYHATDFVLPPVRRGTTTIVQVHDLSLPARPRSGAPRPSNPGLKKSSRLPCAAPTTSWRTRRPRVRTSSNSAPAVPGAKISVLYGGVNPRFRPSPPRPPKSRPAASTASATGPSSSPSGTLQPRKNHARLLASLARLRAACPDLHLVIAGGAGWLADPFHQQLRESGLAHLVRLPGYVADEDLPALYSAAAVFAFPSLYEGFGLPVLEAMACGVPVVTLKSLLPARSRR